MQKSIWAPDDVKALIPVVRQHVSVDRILNMRDCVGNPPPWYTRYPQAAANRRTMVGNPPKGKLALEQRIFEEYLKAREKRNQHA